MQHVVETLNIRLDVAASNKALLVRVNDAPNVALEPKCQDTCQNLDVHIEQADGSVVFRLRLGPLLVKQNQRADKLERRQTRVTV